MASDKTEGTHDLWAIDLPRDRPEETLSLCQAQPPSVNPCFLWRLQRLERVSILPLLGQPGNFRCAFTA